MASVEEVLAKAAEWEAAGQPDKAAKLRSYAKTLTPTAAAPRDAVSVLAKAAEWEAAGNAANAAKLRAYADTLKPAPAPASGDAVAVPDAGPALPPRLDAPQDNTAAFAAFEAANPILVGRYSADKFPKIGDVVAGKGGGGKSGGARYTVQGSPDAFGDTAAAMAEGPMLAASAFGGGLTGGPSPSRDFLANDPLTKGLPDFALTGLGALGDVAGAGLSSMGAGIAGGIGLASELVPGQNAQDERALSDDLMGMTMFAVPELAGLSSVAGRAASVAAKAPQSSRVTAVAPQIAGDVAAAERLGIPVMRSDVKPPSTFIGGVAQKTGESIPVAGTGAVRAKQNAARIEAAQSFVREYDADSAAPAIDDVMAGLLEKRSADVKRYSKQKADVIRSLPGAVPVPKAVAAIDAQIARLSKQKMEGLNPVIAKLQEFKAAIQEQQLPEIEANRAVIGEAFSGLDMGAIRGAGEKALSAVYGPLRADMADFIKANGGTTALNKWGSANAKLSEMAGELSVSALKRALSKGEASPEVVKSLLFSSKPSDVRLIYKGLNDQGRASARTAVVQEALAKAGGIDDLSPDKFKQALGKLSSQVGVFFKGDDFAAADGLVRALKLTERAGKAGVAPLTGVQNLPAVVAVLVNSMFGGSIAATAGALGGIGAIARVYEATGVKSALRGIAKAQTPAAEATALQSLAQALKNAGVTAKEAGQSAALPATGQAANANGGPAYEQLWERYK